MKHLWLPMFSAFDQAMFCCYHFGVCVFFAGEIDRCLKKVTEGVETFEDIWQKVRVRKLPNV